MLQSLDIFRNISQSHVQGGRARTTIFGCEFQTYKAFVVVALTAEMYDKREVYASELKQRNQQKEELIADVVKAIKRFATLAYRSKYKSEKNSTVRDC